MKQWAEVAVPLSGIGFSKMCDDSRTGEVVLKYTGGITEPVSTSLLAL